MNLRSKWRTLLWVLDRPVVPFGWLLGGAFLGMAASFPNVFGGLLLAIGLVVLGRALWAMGPGRRRR